MDNKDAVSKSDSSFFKPWMIALIVIAMAWLVGAGFLAFVSYMKQM